LGLLNWLRGEDVVGRDETRSIIKPDRGEVPLSGVGLPTVWSGTRYWNLEPVEALAIADVWSCVRVLADTVSSLPLHVYRKTERGRQRVTSGRLVELLEHPAPGVSEADLTSTLMTHLAIWGNGYLGKLRGPDGQVAQLTLLHPDRVQPELVDGRLRFRYDPPKGGQQLLTEADVVHVKGLSVDGLVGLSAVSQAARVLGLSDSLVKHAMSYFESETPRPAGVVHLGGERSPEGEDRTLECQGPAEAARRARAHG
jgi:HK97 family phage portal protein